MEGILDCGIRGNSKESRGALVVLEGLDRSGKSSQCSRLVSYLEGRGISSELWRFPDRTTNVGQMISAYLANTSQLDDHTINLLFSANRWEKRFVMLVLFPIINSVTLLSFYCAMLSFLVDFLIMLWVEGWGLVRV